RTTPTSWATIYPYMHSQCGSLRRSDRGVRLPRAAMCTGHADVRSPVRYAMPGRALRTRVRPSVSRVRELAATDHFDGQPGTGGTRDDRLSELVAAVR